MEHPKWIGDRSTLAIMAVFHEAKKRDYVGDVDAFAVYCRETTGVYLVPIEEVPSRQCWLRVDPARNNQSKRTRLATDYEIGRVSIAGLRAPSGA